jgi:hypothetical protein
MMKIPRMKAGDTVVYNGGDGDAWTETISSPTVNGFLQAVYKGAKKNPFETTRAYFSGSVRKRDGVWRFSVDS